MGDMFRITFSVHSATISEKGFVSGKHSGTSFHHISRFHRPCHHNEKCRPKRHLIHHFIDIVARISHNRILCYEHAEQFRHRIPAKVSILTHTLCWCDPISENVRYNGLCSVSALSSKGQTKLAKAIGHN